MTKTYDVVGSGNAIVDVLAKCDDAFLADNGIEKGIIVKYSCGTSSAKIFELKPLMEPATVKVRLQCY